MCNQTCEVENDFVHTLNQRYLLTDSQCLEVTLELGFLVQHPEEISGLHSFQFHFPINVHFVTEAYIHQAWAVFTVLACILTCKDKQIHKMTFVEASVHRNIETNLLERFFFLLLHSI